MTTEILIIILILAFAVFWVQKTRREAARERRLRELENKLTEKIEGQLKEMRGTVDGTAETMHKQIKSFTKETEKLRSELNNIQQEMDTISSFQEFFTSPKARGEWGEANLEHILKEYFPAEFYEDQYMFESGQQVDAILKLPNDKILPIDSKFPFDNYRKMIEEEDKERKDKLRRKFLKDVKKKITDISNKYILPSEGTVEFAIMYVPAEAVYYEISTSNEIDVTQYAREKRVVLASPNTIFLTLKAIEHWFRDTRISRKTQKIISDVSKLQKDANKLSDEFRKLGKHLENASSAYERSDKRLDRFADKADRLLDEDLEDLEEE